MSDRRQFLARCAAAAGMPLMPAAFADAPPARPEMQVLKRGHVGRYQGGVYLLPANDETVQWGWFDNAEAPRARIRSGDTIVLETLMASMNQVLPGVGIDEITRLRTAHPGRGPHSITGSVFVEGAMPGDTLRIRINRIVPRSYGANGNLPGALKLGQFPDVFDMPQVKYFYFDMRRGVTEFLPGIEIPVRPFPGIVGVARAESGRYSTVPPGPFGGNLDIRELVEGTTLYLPVFVDGALLWSGDSHGAQGNGEINLTAIETAFNELNLTMDVIKGRRLAWPRIETPTHWITVGYDRDLDRAHDVLDEETVRFVADWQGIDGASARRFMLTHGDVRVSEVVNQVKGLYCMLPKRAHRRPGIRPIRETQRYLVSHAVQPTLMEAMNHAALAMIDHLVEGRGLARLDAYALASLAMDARVGRIERGAAEIHCLTPKALWTPIPVKR